MKETGDGRTSRASSRHHVLEVLASSVGKNLTFSSQNETERQVSTERKPSVQREQTGTAFTWWVKLRSPKRCQRPNPQYL